MLRTLRELLAGLRKRGHAVLAFCRDLGTTPWGDEPARVESAEQTPLVIVCAESRHGGQVVHYARASADYETTGPTSSTGVILIGESATADALFRDIHGKPPGLVALDPALFTTDVASLARAAYADSQPPDGALDPLRLAVLADALEEAGCTNAEVLSHLRTPGPHARGCWALDLVLGKK
jgi:hypothetical protein